MTTRTKSRDKHDRRGASNSTAKTARLPRKTKFRPAAAYEAYYRELAEAVARLQSRGMLDAGGESVSLRIPGQAAFLIALPAGRDRKLAGGFAGMRLIGFDGRPRDERPEALNDSVARTHATLYRLRPDAGAAAITRQPWGSALGSLDRPMPAVFDEQARQLGAAVERLIEPDATVLKKGANTFLYNEGVLLLGITRDRLLFNAELLEKCAQAFLLAHTTGEKIGRLPFYVRYIANGRLLKDERRSAESYARGEVPGGFTAY